MRADTELLKYGVVTALLTAGWFALASVGRNILVESLLGWVGLVVVCLFLRWVIRNKVRPPKG